ncbi:phosphoadenosine phosphosulfate reductase family protein [Vibrio phage 1.177.O._10N.286.45.E10]|nr:phosphoadenosine phosphosulfate reductase family protein [Vibrio phage 1.177.O._10N.286.45.E10]
MKKVVSFSGGRTSAYLCHLMKEKFGDEVDFVYMDTGAEHPKTYEFIRKVNREFNLNLTCLRTDFDTPLGQGNKYKLVDINDIGPDLNPFREMIAKYGVPYIGGMFCTDRMKLVPFTKYCNDKYGRGNYETWLGIRDDEPKRINLNNLKSIRYLAEISIFDKQDILDFWSGMPFDLQIPEQLGNCVFCPKKSNLKLAAAQRDEPEMYHDFLNIIYGDNVRHDNKTGHHSQMYRGKKSLEQVVAMFDGSTGGEIKARIRGTKATNTGSCSESCEVFVCEANQIDMF